MPMANPYGASTPIGQSIYNLGMAFLSNRPSPMQIQEKQADAAYREAMTQKALADTRATQQEAAGPGALADVVRRAMAPRELPRPDPGFAGPMPMGNVPIEQGLTAEAPALLEALSSMGDTGKLGDVMLALIANSGGGDEAKANALLGSGKALGENQAVGIGDRESIRGANAENALAKAMGVVGAQQAGALDRTNAQQAGAMDRLAYTTERKPVSVSAGATAFLPPGHPLAGEGPLHGAPTKSTTQGSLLGEHFDDLESLAPSQQKALGAHVTPGTPRNYLTAEGQQGVTLDGLSDAASGEPIPQGSTVFTGQVQPDNVSGLTTTTRTGLQQQGIALNEFSDMLGELRDVAGSDPTLFGVAGNVRRGAQALGQQAQNLGQLMGRDFDQELGEASAAFGGTVDPTNFDPNLTDIQKLATLTAYRAAAALAAQSGRGLSDKDFQNFRQVIGDPTSWTASQPAFMAGLNRVERMVAQALTRNQAMQGGQPAPAPTPAEAPAQAPQRIRIDAEGNILQ